jgi:alanine racemase
VADLGVDHDLASAGLPALPRTAWLRVDLDRLVGNLAALRAAGPTGVSVEPVVKADAYGHGAVPVARALEDAGANGLCVATFDEGIELRRRGVRLPILVLFPAPPWVAREAADLHISLTVGDPALLARTLEAWGSSDGEAGSRAASLHLEVEVESGLGRGGFRVDDLGPAVAAIRSAPGVGLAGLWTHIGSPDDPARTAAQLTAFGDAEAVLGAAALGSEVGPAAAPGRTHLAASGGILGETVPARSAIRPGLSTYGVLPEGLVPAPGQSAVAAALRPVMSLHARAIRVVDLPVGWGVSYGARFVTARPSRIATLPIGYADGYQRARTGRAEVLVRGHPVPIVGAIAMDAIMADVTDVPGRPVGVDDEFVLLGDQGTRTLTAVDLARSGNTISWEVLASMSRRLPRVYYAAARAVGVRTLTDEAGR